MKKILINAIAVLAAAISLMGAISLTGCASEETSGGQVIGQLDADMDSSDKPDTDDKAGLDFDTGADADSDDTRAGAEKDSTGDDDTDEAAKAQDDEAAKAQADAAYESYLASLREGYEFGNIYPDFEMTDANGDSVYFSEYRGKPLYLNCFTTWCYYCIEEMPDIMKLQEDYGDSIQVIFVDIGETRSEAADFAADYDITLPINHLPDWEIGGMPIDGVPVSMVFDADGVLVDGIVGMTDSDWMESAIEKALTDPQER